MREMVRPAHCGGTGLGLEQHLEDPIDLANDSAAGRDELS